MKLRTLKHLDGVDSRHNESLLLLGLHASTLSSISVSKGIPADDPRLTGPHHTDHALPGEGAPLCSRALAARRHVADACFLQLLLRDVREVAEFARMRREAPVLAAMLTELCLCF